MNNLGLCVGIFLYFWVVVWVMWDCGFIGLNVIVIIFVFFVYLISVVG